MLIKSPDTLLPLDIDGLVQFGENVSPKTIAGSHEIVNWLYSIPDTAGSGVP